jgi:quercetin dioxygenase-like cupin family protein
VQILKGEAQFQLAGEWNTVKAGDWFFMEAGLAHALTATDNLAFLLTLFGA